MDLYGVGYRERVKRQMVEAYGGKCIECGETDFIVLVLDHIDDDGAADRIKLRHAANGYKGYMRLRKLGWPKDRHQLLCHNCNFRKEYHRRRNAVFDAETSSGDGVGGA